MTAPAVAVSSGALQQLRLVSEVNEGVDPATDRQVVPHATVTPPGRNWSRSPTDNVNAQLRVTDNLSGGFTVPGGYNADLDWINHLLALQSNLNQTAESTFVTVAGTDIAFSAAGNKLTSATADKFNAVPLGIPVYVKIVGGTGANSSAWAVATSKVAGVSPELVLSHFAVVNEVAGGTVTISLTGYLTEGTALHTLSGEVADSDTNLYTEGSGLRAGQITISGQQGGKVGIQVTFTGLNAQVDTSTFGTGTNTPEASNVTYPLFNMDTSFVRADEGVSATGGPSTGLYLTQFSVQINGGGEVVRTGGNQGAPLANRQDRYQMQVQLTYLKSATAAGIQSKVDGKIDSNSLIVLRDGAGHELAIFVPRLQYSQGTQSNSGNNQTLSKQYSGMAAASTYGHMIAISRATTT